MNSTVERPTAPYEEGEPPPFFCLETVPGFPTHEPDTMDEQALLESWKLYSDWCKAQVTAAIECVTTKDFNTSDVVDALGELILNAEDIGYAALPDIVPPPDSARRHLLGVTIGYTVTETSAIIIGIHDNTAAWPVSRLRPPTLPIESVFGQFGEGLDLLPEDTGERDELIALLDVTGNGSTIAEGLANKVTYTASAKENTKTVWLRFDTLALVKADLEEAASLN